MSSPAPSPCSSVRPARRPSSPSSEGAAQPSAAEASAPDPGVLPRAAEAPAPLADVHAIVPEPISQPARPRRGRPPGAPRPEPSPATLPKQHTKRAALGRMWVIHCKLLQRHSYPLTAAELTKFTESDERTVHRDLDTMRYTLRLPIGNTRARGYHYTSRELHFIAPLVSGDEFFALAVAAQMAGVFAPVAPLEKGVRGAMRKLHVEACAARGLDLDALREVVCFRALGLDHLGDPALFGRVVTDAMARREIAFSYRALGREHARPCTLEPLYVACIDHVWYVRGIERPSGERRNFALGRLRELRETGRRFVRPAREEDEAGFAHALGAFGGHPPVRVVVRVHGMAAAVAVERPWHRSQKVRVVSEDKIDLHLRVSDKPDLLQRVLRWGAEAEVREPLRLREEVLAHARAIAARG